MSEQGFLNAYFDKDTELVIEAEQYNCMPQHRCFFKSNNVSILHFTIIKPKTIIREFRCWLRGIRNMCNIWSEYRRELTSFVDVPV
jgi:hypothetical protein